MTRLAIALDRCLAVDDADPRTALGLARIVASGVIVLGVGCAIALCGYVTHSFRWPADRSNWRGDV